MNAQSRSTAGLLFAVATAGVLAGCLQGKDPPAPTELVQISGGSFTLGSSRLKCGGKDSGEEERCDSGKSTDPLSWIEDLSWVPAVRVVALPSFAIEAHEVTNAQYEYCVQSGSCTEPAFSEVGGKPYYGDPRFADHPVVWVTRAQAETYCRFVGRQLPNEAQWERAARLGSNGEMRTYPYAGEEPPNCTKTSSHYLVSKDCADQPLAVTYSKADVTYLGVRNMASNVAEWVRDDWDRYAYCAGRSGYADSCQKQGTACPACKKDGARCAKSCQPDKLVICGAGMYALFRDDGTDHVVRGGSYRLSRCFLRLFVRSRAFTARADIGFRCVHDSTAAAPAGG